MMLMTERTPQLVLAAETAADLMSPNPVSLREDATVREAVTLLADRGFGAAPVINWAGHPVGVLSQTDIVVHDREEVRHVPTAAEFCERTDQALHGAEGFEDAFQVEEVDRTRVADIMMPVVFTVDSTAPAAKVVEQMLALKVHHLYVVDANGVLAGVVSSLDVLRHLRP